MEFHKVGALFFCLCIGTLSEGYLTNHYMPLPCSGGATANLKVNTVYSSYGSSGILKLDSYSWNADCTMVLQNAGLSAILISLKEMNLFYSNNVITFDDGYSSTTIGGTIFYPNHKVVYTSKHPGADVRVNFKANGGGGSGGFELVYTAFKNGTNCENLGLHQCDNSRCIATEVACDGYNHCGGVNPDECGLSVGAIVGYIFGSLFLIVACVCIIVGLYRRNQRKQTVGSTAVIHPPPSRYVPPAPMINPIHYPPAPYQGFNTLQYPERPPPYSAPVGGTSNPMYH